MALLRSSLVLCFLVFHLRPSHQGPDLKRSYEVSIINQVNQTGHCTIDFALTQASNGFRRNWRANIKHEIFDDGGVEKHFVTGHLSAPPPRPRDYELFPGIGYYKFHSEAKTMQEGVKICAQEGGHLMIVNSYAEANVVKILYARHPDVWKWANIGFSDLDEDGHYETIFGKSLESTGYNKWYPDEPDSGRPSCGVIERSGLLGGGACHGTRPFICEYDLSWSD